MVKPPTGTVTFLFTDMEGSTRLLQKLGDQYQDMEVRHAEILRRAITEGGGTEIRTEGDSFFASFPRPAGAVQAAVTAQRELARHRWPDDVPIRVRMGMHTGEGKTGRSGSATDYIGIDVNRAARIAAAGHGGQVLISEATRGLVENSLPEGVTLRDLGKHRLKDIEYPERLYDLVIDGLPADFPPVRTLEVPTNLPAPLTSFIGRDRELARIAQLLEDGRLLTLTGAGGCGKTRLAIEAATRLLPSYSDGGFFVDLAPITDPGLVASTVAVALGVREEPTRFVEESLRDALRDREMLLVLDNFEQLLGAAPLITEVLAAAPRVRLLVTSRAALRLSGEQQLPVPPLPVPDPRDLPPAVRLSEYAAVALFAQRATGVDPDFSITDENAPAVAEICAGLDGLPLAIELAASRIRLLSPSDMRDRLQHRLALLTGGARDLPSRQRTLREAIGWSYDLLEGDEQTLFSRLATFVGGWTVEAAEAVANPGRELGVETLDGLGSLMDKSLVRREHGDDTRFGMLETIREFGVDVLQRAGDAEEIRRRHAWYFLEIAEAAEPELTRRDPRWLDRLEREHDNLRAALRWAIETGEAEPGLRIAGAVWRFWQVRDHLAEGRRRTEELLALPGAAAPSAARAKALSAAGSLAYWLHDPESVREAYEESLAIYRELGDRPGEAEGAYNLAFAYMLEGDMGAAKKILHVAVEVSRRLDDPVRLAYANMALSFIAGHEGDLDAGGALVEDARRTFLEAGDLWGFAVASGTQAAFAMKEGDHERARISMLDSLDAAEALSNNLSIAVSLQGLAILAIRQRRPERGLRLAGAAQRIKEEAGGEAPPLIVGLDDPLEIAKGSLPGERIGALYEEGRSMSLEQAMAYARGES
jgi:predicted ATPase/class 3 adenylate cyclase